MRGGRDRCARSCRGSFGAVDAVERRAEIEGARAERVLEAAAHVPRQVGTAPQHLRRRAPIRPFALHRHGLGARPGEALAPDADAVLDRLAAPEHVVEPPLRGRDHDRARRLPAVPRHDLARDRLLAEDVEEVGKRPARERVRDRESRRGGKKRHERAEPGENADHGWCPRGRVSSGRSGGVVEGEWGGNGEAALELVTTAIPCLGSVACETMSLPSGSTTERMDEDLSAAGALSRIKTAEGGGPSARP